MTTRAEIENRFPKLRGGMLVYTGDGEKLGTIVALEDDSFIVEKGIFFPKDFTVHYNDIIDVDPGDDRVVLSRHRNELESWRDSSYHGWGLFERLSLGGIGGVPPADLTPPPPERSFRDEEDVRVPVAKEELEVEKTRRQTGEIRVRKVVHTDIEHLEVPVRREEVHIERMAASDPGAVPSGDHLFKEESFTIPVMGEEIEVHKRPVIREEVHIHKGERLETESVQDRVRREEVRIDEQGDTKGHSSM